jgi:hypothetical protein
MNTLESFDPPMCCATGVCGPEPELARLAGIAPEEDRS